MHLIYSIWQHPINTSLQQRNTKKPPPQSPTALPFLLLLALTNQLLNVYLTNPMVCPSHLALWLPHHHHHHHARVPDQTHRNRHRRHHHQRKGSHGQKKSCSGSSSRRHSFGEAVAAMIFRQVAAPACPCVVCASNGKDWNLWFIFMGYYLSWFCVPDVGESFSI